MKLAIVLLLAIITVGCSGGSHQLAIPDIIPPAQGQSTPPATVTIHKDINGGQCPQGCYTHSPGRYLSLKLGPTDTQNGVHQYVFQLSTPMDVSVIQNWIGTAQGVTLEADARLQVQYPDGTWEEWYNEIDKHTDTRAESVLVIPVKRHFPAGTVFVLYGNYVNGPDAAACSSQACVDQMWKLYSEN